MKRLLLIGLSLSASSGAVALNNDAPIARLVDDKILVEIAPHLNERQLDMIKGGFATLSELTVFKRIGDDNEPQDVLAKVRCSVRYDAWEETFDLVVLQATPDKPRSEFLKSFAVYAQLCLSHGMEKDLPNLNDSPFYVRLSVKQTSSEESLRIKDWLVKQQSGVIQTLFSHMLGELALSESITARVLPLPIEESKGGAAAPDPRQTEDAAAEKG